MNRPLGSSLGIDFGTSHTIAVVRRADRSVRPLLFDGSPLMPSAVCVDSEGGVLVGRDAVHAGRRHPERFEPNPKRLLDSRSILLGEREYPVVELVSAALRAVAVECHRVVGAPGQVTVTVPADWGPTRRQVVVDAADAAGLGQVRLVPEPVAAATYYAETLKHRMAVDSSIVVYDLGAGTFDASVVRRAEHGFDTVALDGRNDLGGLDIDAALIGHLGATYGGHDGWRRLVGPATVEERRHFREFQEEIRGAKERLSRHQHADISIPLLDVEAHLTRAELEQIAQPHLERTIEVTRAVIRTAGLDLHDSAGLFLVGGASRMPLVATMLHRAFGVPPTVLDQPEVVVAEGSVLWAESGAQAPRTGTLPLGTLAPTAAALPTAPAQSPSPEAASTSPQHEPSTTLPLGAATSPARQEQPAYALGRSDDAGPHSPTGTADLAAPRTPAGRSEQASPQAGAPTAPGRNLPPTLTPAQPPPEAGAVRGSRKRISRRVVLTVIAVDILIVAALFLVFRPDDESGGTGDDPGSTESGVGQLNEEIDAHDGGISSFASLASDDDTLLFSAAADGTVKAWSMSTGDLAQEFEFEQNVSSLWATTDIDGDPAMVAVDESYGVHMWVAGDDAFTDYGSPEMADSQEGILRLTLGKSSGTPMLAAANSTGYEFYDIADEAVFEQGPLPEGYGRPNVYFEGETPQLVMIEDETGALTHVFESEADPEWSGGPDDGRWGADAAVEGFGIVYDRGSPHGMLYSDNGTVHLWDLTQYPFAAAGWDPTYYGDIKNHYYRHTVPIGDAQGLMCITPDGTLALQPLGGGEADLVELGDGDVTGQGIVEVTNADLAGGRGGEGGPATVALTGTTGGTIQFWSLG